MITIEYTVQFKHDKITFCGNFKDMEHFHSYMKERNNFASEPLSYYVVYSKAN